MNNTILKIGLAIAICGAYATTSVAETKTKAKVSNKNYYIGGGINFTNNKPAINGLLKNWEGTVNKQPSILFGMLSAQNGDYQSYIEIQYTQLKPLLKNINGYENDFRGDSLIMRVLSKNNRTEMFQKSHSTAMVSAIFKF